MQVQLVTCIPILSTNQPSVACAVKTNNRLLLLQVCVCVCVCACLTVCWDCVQGLLCSALTLVKLPGSHIPPSVQVTAGTKQTLSDHCNPTFRRFLALGNRIACSKAETRGEGTGGRGGEQGKRARLKEKKEGIWLWVQRHTASTQTRPLITSIIGNGSVHQ